ncbi:MAG: helix-turn-helix transcriptional regulator [Ornithinimicrobium sp.]
MAASSPPPPRAGADRIFAALLKYWRGQRGLSQLDLALTADVSSRHVSFLETGRSRPSEEMVLVLAEALDIALRDRNSLLSAAGFAPRYPEPDVSTLLLGPLGQAMTLMLAHHEPYPMVVLDRLYEVVKANTAARHLLEAVRLATGVEDESNLLRLLCHPQVRPLIVNFDEAARTVLRRLQRDALHRPQDEDMADLLSALLATEGVGDLWRAPHCGSDDHPVVALRLRLGDVTLAFTTAVTVFSAPQSLTLEELQIESWFPLDDATAAACRDLFGD